MPAVVPVHGEEGASGPGQLSKEGLVLLVHRCVLAVEFGRDDAVGRQRFGAHVACHQGRCRRSRAESEPHFVEHPCEGCVAGLSDLRVEEDCGDGAPLPCGALKRKADPAGERNRGELKEVAAEHQLDASKRSRHSSYSPRNLLKRLEKLRVQHRHLIDHQHLGRSPPRARRSVLHHLAQKFVDAALAQSDARERMNRLPANVGSCDS
eukprot:2718651-Rhodomonas_salina.1